MPAEDKVGLEAMSQQLQGPREAVRAGRGVAADRPLDDHVRPLGTQPSRRDDIVHAAVTVFVRTGYTEACLEEVAARANVNITTLYYHFGGKERLLAEALTMSMDRLGQAIPTRWTEGESSSPEALRQLVAAVWEWCQLHADEARLIHRYSQAPVGPGPQVRTAWEARHLGGACELALAGRSRAHARGARAQQHAVDSLAATLVLDIILAAGSAAIAGGDRESDHSAAFGNELVEVCVRVMSALGRHGATATSHGTACRSVGL